MVWDWMVAVMLPPRGRNPRDLETVGSCLDRPGRECCAKPFIGLGLQASRGDATFNRAQLREFETGPSERISRRLRI